MAIECPKFVGLKLSDIRNNAEYKDKFVFTEKWSENNEFDYGYVYEQSIKAGGPVKKGAKITLYVSMGTPSATVPNVVGLTESEAVSKLKALEFEVEIVKEYNDSIAEGNVIKTDPQTTTVVQKGATVTVYVSLGTEPADPNQDTMEGFSPWM